MPKLAKPPKTYQKFTEKYTKLRDAWDLASEAGREGPLDDKTQRLLKLALAIGGMREGAVHSAVRKAVASGATADEIGQVVALAASTLGFPSTVAAFSWIEDEMAKKKRKK